jgi:transcriptional regulator with XRE-family HTH domain
MPAILTPSQCRKARSALGWTMRDLRAKSNVSTDAISRLERGEKLKDRTLQDIKRAFVAAGIRFLQQGPQTNGS